jgi:hypothetical protein
LQSADDHWAQAKKTRNRLTAGNGGGRDVLRGAGARQQGRLFLTVMKLVKGRRRKSEKSFRNLSE